MKHKKISLLGFGYLLSASLSWAGEPLIQSCLSCHAMDTELVGPPFKTISKKYSGKKGSEDRLVQQIRDGSSGEWGSMAMPPNVKLSESDAHLIVKWILSLKGKTVLPEPPQRN